MLHCNRRKEPLPAARPHAPAVPLGVIVEKPAQHRFLALDSLRGICALLVAMYHLMSSGYLINNSFIKHSWLFVDFFFVLSGFVIAASYRERLENGYSVTRFMALRLGRVYPLHLFILAVLALAETAKLLLGPTGLSQKVPWQSPNSVEQLLQSLGLVHVFLNDDGVWNGPSWSIATEVWAYLIVAIMLSVMGARARRLFPVIVIGSLAVLYFQGEPYLARISGTAMLRCIAGFALGMMTYDWFCALQKSGKGLPGGAGLAEWAVLALVVAFVMANSPLMPTNLFAPFVFALAVLVFAFQGGIVSRWLMRPFPVLLGTLSYSIYMVHTFIEARMIDVLNVISARVGIPFASISPYGNRAAVKMVGSPDNPLLGDLMTLVVLAVIVIVSWFTYRFIELPCREYVRRRVGKTAAAPGLAG